jgi:hypothetical protein
MCVLEPTVNFGDLRTLPQGGVEGQADREGR